MRIVLKIGGNELNDNEFLEKVSAVVSKLHQGNHKIILVHGGGKEITHLLGVLGLETRFVNGMRYTDAPTLDVVEMSLSGLINKRLVKLLQKKNLSAIGVSGVDARIIVADKMLRDGEDVGLVGEATQINVAVVEDLMSRFVVVLSPIGINRDSTSSLNVNADYAAAAVASAINSELTIFLSNVPGVIDKGAVLPKLDEKDFVNLSKTGIITGGMVPKIEAAFRALKGGVQRTFITDADGALHLVIGENAGTQVIA